jgi:RimJ/RimL family protein N-acetyltransferase
MIFFMRSTDYDLIREIMTHKAIYRHIADDSSPAAEDYYPVESDQVWYVVVRDIVDSDVQVLGLWMFVPQNGVCWDVHTCLLPAAWGERAHAAARMLPSWIWEHTPCRRIVTSVPSNNRLALHFATEAGMTIFGVNRASYLKCGVLHDQVCLGISKPEGMPIVDVCSPVAASEEVPTCQQQ